MTRTRDEWTETFHGVDACCFPVLDIDEARAYEHNVKRGVSLHEMGGGRGGDGCCAKRSDEMR